MVRFLLVSAAVGLCSPAIGQVTVTFENGTLAQPLPGANTFQNGATLNPPGGFSSAGASFNNSYESTFGSWSGWSYANVVNTATPGFGNQFAAYHLPGGGGDGSANYAVGFPSDFEGVVPTATLPGGTRPQSIRITNTTYAALSMQAGDAFAKKFGGPTGNDPDFFRLTVAGKDGANQSTGSVVFYLADYRFADNTQDYIVSQWTTVDLTGLGAATASLAFTLESSDVGAFGMNTPGYFAADNLVLVPEPAGLLAVLAVGWVARRRL